MIPRRRSPWLVTVGLALLAGVAASPLLAARKRPSEVYAEREAKFLRSIAARYADLAEWCSRNKLWQFARENDEEALEYDPDQKEAREYLGFERRGAEWVEDPDAPVRKEKNEYARGQEIAFKKLVRDYEKRKQDLVEWIAEKYAKLGLWCRKHKLELQARKAFERSLRFDENNTRSHKALGHVEIDGFWLTPEQDQARKDAQGGKMVDDGRSSFERQTGLKLNKIESGHFRIESVFGKEALEAYVKGCETAYAYFLRDMGRNPTKAVWRQRIQHLILQTKEQWDAWVDRNAHGSQKQKEFTKKTTGTKTDTWSVAYRAKNGSVEVDVDGLVHRTVHMLVTAELHLGQTWLQEGFAYYYTVKVLNSTQTHCVAWDMYSNRRNDVGWGDSKNWKELLKKEVETGADFDLRTIVGLKLDQMKQPQAVKAWGLITWFFDENKDAFMAWMKDVAAGDEQADAFEKHFGKTYEQLDAEWRDYVKENY